MPNCSWKLNSYPKSSALPFEFLADNRHDTHLDHVLDHFGAAMVAIYENFRFQSQIATNSEPNLFGNRSG